MLDPETSEADELYFDDTSNDAANQKHWKKTPKWDISYRQSVSASDMFLGVNILSKNIVDSQRRTVFFRWALKPPPQTAAKTW